MIILITFAFIAGIVTILSPCILPILPVVLSGTVASGKRKPLGIMVGFILSFTFFTLATSALVRATGLNPDYLRTLSIAIVALFGLTLVLPQLQTLSEQLFSKLTRFSPKASSTTGFWGGVLIGLSIGLVWTPCVGPILAAVISLSFTTTVSYGVVLITLAYALGTAIPMLGIIYAGRSLFSRIPFLLSKLPAIQKGFGFLMILTAVALATNTDRTIQTYLLTKFPQWGEGLTALEDNNIVQTELDKLQGRDSSEMALMKDQPMPAPELVVGGEWFNSEPLSMSELKGQVVLVDFWTYTCINCIRTIPYLKKWDELYGDKGLTIVGVHSPEFAFEKNANNVRKAITDYGIQYPVMQDNDFATWRNYENRYWPAKYLVNMKGEIVYRHFGEGAYDETEAMIQTLLKERDNGLELNAVQNEQYELQARTPETYLGWSRMKGLAVTERVQTDTLTMYSPEKPLLDKNTYSWKGNVLIAKEYANPQKGAVLQYNYEAKDVFLVMRSKTGSGSVKILLDGKTPTQTDSGIDVDNGSLRVGEDRLYRLVESDNSGEHILTIEFMDNNVEVFAFTFG